MPKSSDLGFPSTELGERVPDRPLGECSRRSGCGMNVPEKHVFSAP